MKYLAMSFLNLFTFGFFIIGNNQGKIQITKVHWPLIIQVFQYIENWITFFDDLVYVLSFKRLSPNYACKFEGCHWHQNYMDNWFKNH